jgi:benzoylformate decarboxylase
MNDPRRPTDLQPAASLSGRAAFLSLLASEGVEVLFGNPGTTELAIMEALAKQSQIEYALGLQESIVVAMADGYARASNRLAACNVHVAPGLGNAMGALYNAKFYGSPVIVTAGQQEQGHGLKEPMLYDPLVPIAKPLVKWAIEVTRVQDLPRIVRRAAKVATTPPTGPVFISLPGDVLDAEAELDLGKPTRVDSANRPADATLERLADTLLRARNPVLIAGHELCTRDALQEAAQLAELLGAPVHQQTVPYAAHFLSEHPAFLGALTRNQQQVRDALSPYDLIVFLGADQLRMSVYSPVEPLPGRRAWCKSAARWELAKNYRPSWHRGQRQGDAAALLPVLQAKRSGARGAGGGAAGRDRQQLDAKRERAKQCAETAQARRWTRGWRCA